MIGGTHVAQVVRAVANGDGDWAEVPRCVREAVVLALAGRESQAAGGVGATAEAAARRHCDRWPEPREGSRAAVSSLSEEVVQRSVRTFEDAAWVRDQAVRSFAQFHNTVEETREGLRHHLRALWRTAAQLDPALLRDLRRERGLSPGDEVPENVVLPTAALRRLRQLEAMVDEVADGVEALRWASVRFAANLLSDDEKRAMGLDPADLRAEDVPPGPSSTPPRPGEEPTLSERRQCCMSRVALLDGASMQQLAEEEPSHHRFSQSTKGAGSQHRAASESSLSSLGARA
ncbi:uncharacterized protein Tco025E_06363 [Trypanosoma conorhini]|uniref:Uncharacterized protein n=1 Tax=Trypanosoma conorhini TaxID=83891 RepID=A0A3R7RU80_9TRYP|nr:uncharacterized protein Tco025E_06363 [Trypanosoma conorhini]RNF13056.1 hypothetical protein Tco025E_06363 [Trypanosoma conorhini]